MSITTNATAAPATSLSSALAGGPSAADGEQRFLKLLVTQLNNQDPLNPLDNAQLTSQLAQMSTVSGIEKLNAAFSSLIAQSNASQVLQSASLIGRSVLVPGQQLNLTGGAPEPLSVDLPQGAEKLQLSIVDAAGNTVRRLEYSSLATGTQQLAWDGRGDNGAVLPAGSYQVNAAAFAGGGAVASTTLAPARVASIAQGNGAQAGTVLLDLASGARVKLSDVRLIS